VVAAILRNPAGHPRRLNANSCNVGPIYINLIVADIDIFRAELPRIFQAHPIGGIGDGAYWNGAGALSAVKGHNRGCDISVIDPGAPKIHNAELGQKLGEICNKLFAIP
jgi:DNA-binding LytR/AlgR family response regulator